MSIKSIIRSKGGRREREVLVSEIVVPDVRSYPRSLPDERWITAVSRYYNDTRALLRAIKLEKELPKEFFVPHLWDTAIKLRDERTEIMLDFWRLGRELAFAVGYSEIPHCGEETYLRNGVFGTILRRES